MNPTPIQVQHQANTLVHELKKALVQDPGNLSLRMSLHQTCATSPRGHLWAQAEQFSCTEKCYHCGATKVGDH